MHATRGETDPRPGARGELRLALVGLVLLCVGVLWLRTRNLDYLLPHQPEPDLYSVVQVDHLRAKAAGSEAAAPFQFYFYPMLLARLHLALPEPPPPATPAPGEDALAAHLRGAGATLERSRTIVAWLSVLAVPATFAIALAFTRPWIALLAAALAGTSFLHLVFSGQARPHGMAAGFVALTIAAAIGMRRRPTPGTYLLAGVAGMLALCSLQNGSAALLALGAAHLLRERARDRGGWKKILPPLAVIAGGVLFFYAFFVEKAAAETTQSYTSPRLEGGVLKYGGHEIDLKLFRGQGFPKLDDFLRWNDPLLLWAGALGLVFALGHLARKRGRIGGGRARDLGVLLAHALPYTFMLGLFAKTFERYLLPLLPVLALLSAVGIAGVAALVTRPLARRAGLRAAVAAALAIAPLAWPVSNAWQLAHLRGVPDTQEVAAAWLRERVAPDERVVTGPGLILPTFYAPGAIPALDPRRLHVQWLRYQAAWHERWSDAPKLHVTDGMIVDGLGVPKATLERLREPADTLAWLDAQNADWFVLENSQRMRHTLSKKSFDLLRQALFARGERVLHVRPHPERRIDFKDYQDAREAVTLARGAERLGPEIEIWKLARP